MLELGLDFERILHFVFLQVSCDFPFPYPSKPHKSMFFCILSFIVVDLWFLDNLSQQIIQQNNKKISFFCWIDFYTDCRDRLEQL